MMHPSSNNPLRHVEKRPWLWKVRSSWKLSDEVVEHILSPSVLKEKYNEQQLWWFYFRIRNDYYEVRSVDSSLILDANKNEISTVAHRIVHQLTLWSSPNVIEIMALASTMMSYGSEPNKPIHVYEQVSGKSITNMMLRICSTSSLEAYREKQIEFSKSR